MSEQLPDGPRWCKYCYAERDLELGSDGSIIVCSTCKHGLALTETGESYDAFQDRITREFVALNRAN